MPNLRIKLMAWTVALLMRHPLRGPVKSRAFPRESADTTEQLEEAPPAGDWAPQLLDAMLSSPNPEAAEALLHASFAAGPDLVPFSRRA